MIRYALQCDGGHGFEAWFGDSAAYDDQAARGLVECPHCGSHEVSKQIMAPAVAGTRKSALSADPASDLVIVWENLGLARAIVSRLVNSIILTT